MKDQNYVQVIGTVQQRDTADYPYMLVAIRGKFDPDELRELIIRALTKNQ